MSAPSRPSNSQGTAIGKYLLLDCIAESMMSKVYRARLSFGKTSRIVVVKTLHPRFLSSEESREQFYREIQTTMSLAHANIVQIHDCGEEKGCPFIVMEWVHGRNLKEILSAESSRRGKGIDLPLACHFAEQIAMGLEYAHTLKDRMTGESLELVHRDLSPHNVIVAFDGAVKLIDFGIARMAHQEDETLSEQVWGKVGYFSPEQVQGKRLDRRSDIFALGAVLFELISGKKLFSGKSNMLALEKVRTAETHVPKMISRQKKLPAPVVAILTRCLRPNPKDRYAFAGDVARDLRAFLASQKEGVDAGVVARYLSNLLPGEIQKDQAALRALSVQPANISVTYDDSPLPDVPELEDIGENDVPVDRPLPQPAARPPRRGGRGWLFKLAVVAAILVANPFLQTPQPKGRLALKTPPASTARITDGKKEWIVRDHFAQLELVPGQYRAYVVEKSGKRQTLVFQIRENLTTLIPEDLVGPKPARHDPDSLKQPKASPDK